MTDRYESPLSTRYASDDMLRLFSAETRIRTWRALWVSLARAEHRLGGLIVGVAQSGRGGVLPGKGRQIHQNG